MQTLEISDKNILVNIPSDWDELSPTQFRYILKQTLLLSERKIDLDKFRINCFYKLANIQRDWKTILWEKFSPKHLVEEKNGNIFLLANFYTQFLFKPNAKNKKLLELNFNTVVNHLPIIKRFRKFYGPADILADLTFGEFRAAIEEMNNFFLDKNPHSLNRMIVCLYRPAGGDPEQNSGRIREPFNRERIERHAKRLTGIPHWQSFAILLWFTWCVNYLQTGDLILGGQTVNLSPLFPKKNEDSGEIGTAGLGWTGVLYGIAKEGIFGDIDRADKAGLFDILLFMYNNHIQNEKTKIKTKQ